MIGMFSLYFFDCLGGLNFWFDVKESEKTTSGDLLVSAKWGLGILKLMIKCLPLSSGVLC